MKTPSAWPVAVALTGLGIAHLWVIGHWWYLSVGVYDAGIVVHGSERVATGQVPYRDFFLFLGPLAVWLPGWYFALVGVSTSAISWSIILVGALHATASWALARAAGLSGWASAGVWLFTLGCAYPLWPVPSHHWHAALLQDAALLTAIGWYRKGGLWLLALTGGLATAAVAVLQPVGGLALMAFAYWVWRRGGNPGFAVFAAAGAAVAVAVIALLAAHGALEAAWYAAVIFPLFEYGGKNVAPFLLTDSLNVTAAVDLPRAALQWLTLQALGWLTPLVYVVLAWRLRGQLVERGAAASPPDAARGLLLLVGTATLLASAYSLTLVHFAYVATPALILLLVALQRLHPAGRARGIALARPAVVLALLLTIPLPQVYHLVRGEIVYVTLPRGRVALGTPGEDLPYDLQGLADQVARVSAPGEPIYVYPALGILYTLLDRPNATRFDYLFPGENPSAQIDALLQQLDERAVRLVIYDPLSTEWVAHYSELGGIDGARVDAYLAERYRAIGQHGQLQILERR